MGLVASAKERDDTASSGDDDYDALVLSHGRRIASGDVVSHIQTVNDIITFRRDETSDSSFFWAPVIDQQTLTSDDVRTLRGLFEDGSWRSSEVLLSLTRAAEQNGDRDTALSLALNVLQNASGDAWLRTGGGTRRRAAATAVRLGGQEARVTACRDLAYQATAISWFPRLLPSDLATIIEALDPDLDAATTWPAIRAYLNGIAETLNLPGSDVLTDHGCRWWLLEPTGDQRTASNDSTPTAALTELAVGHLSHPTWLIRDAAAVIVVRALNTANEKIAGALARFAQGDASDDTLERAGRCLAAAKSRDGYVIPSVLQPLEQTLANHPSQVIRNLAANRSQL